MAIHLALGSAPVLSALEKRLGELIQICERLEAENRGLHQRTGWLEAELAASRGAHAEEVRHLRATYASDIADAHQAHAAELSRLHDAYAHETQTLRTRLEIELAETRAASEQALTQLRSDSERSIEEARARCGQVQGRLDLMVARLRALET